MTYFLDKSITTTKMAKNMELNEQQIERFYQENIELPESPVIRRAAWGGAPMARDARLRVFNYENITVRNVMFQFLRKYYHYNVKFWTIFGNMIIDCPLVERVRPENPPVEDYLRLIHQGRPMGAERWIMFLKDDARVAHFKGAGCMNLNVIRKKTGVKMFNGNFMFIAKIFLF